MGRLTGGAAWERDRALDHSRGLVGDRRGHADRVEPPRPGRPRLPGGHEAPRLQPHAGGPEPGRARVVAMTGAETYRGKGLIVDPIHGYLLYTRAAGVIPRRGDRAGPDRHALGAAPPADPAAPVGPLGVPHRRAQPLPARPRRDARRRPLRAAALAVAPGGLSRTRPRPRSWRSSSAWPGSSTTWAMARSGTSSTRTSWPTSTSRTSWSASGSSGRSSGTRSGAPAEPPRPVRARRGDRPRVDLLPHGQGLHAAGAGRSALAGVPEAAALRDLHGGQPRLRPSRRPHVRRRGGGGPRPDHLLQLLHAGGPDARPERDAGAHHVPDRALLHVHERLLPPDDARDRPPPQGDLPPDDAHRLSRGTSGRTSSRTSTSRSGRSSRRSAAGTTRTTPSAARSERSGGRCSTAGSGGAWSTKRSSTTRRSPAGRACVPSPSRPRCGPRCRGRSRGSSSRSTSRSRTRGRRTPSRWETGRSTSTTA